MSKKEKNIIARRLAHSYLSSIISISLVLLLVGFFALLAVNATQVSNYFKENIAISVILKSHVEEKEALEIDEKRLTLLERITKDVFSVHRAGDVRSVVNSYKDDKERQKAVMDLLEAAVRDILLAQAGTGSLEDSGISQEAVSYARAVPLAGGLRLSGQITRARMMLGSNVSFASAFESILLEISEEYAKWPW